jgi:hypothetical protein
MNGTHVQHEETRTYAPKAIYYEQSDSLEYVRADEPALYRRVDEYLTLILHLESRKLIGFKLKGFRHLYLTHLQPKYHFNRTDYLKLINILEDAMSIRGDAIFAEAERRMAYSEALEIASQDDVVVEQFPRRAAR